MWEDFQMNQTITSPWLTAAAHRCIFAGTSHLFSSVIYACFCPPNTPHKYVLFFFYQQRSKTHRSIMLKCTKLQPNGRLRLEAQPTVKDGSTRKKKKLLNVAMAQRDDVILREGVGWETRWNYFVHLLILWSLTAFWLCNVSALILGGLDMNNPRMCWQYTVFEPVFFFWGGCWVPGNMMEVAG